MGTRLNTINRIPYDDVSELMFTILIIMDVVHLKSYPDTIKLRKIQIPCSSRSIGIQSIVLAILLLSIPEVSPMTELNGGWSSTLVGQGSSSGVISASTSSGDPSIALGITSSSALFGPGKVIDAKKGTQSVEKSIGGFNLKVSFDGDVSSETILTSQGTASASAFVGATGTGLSTGGPSHEIFGSAKISVDGYLQGEGSSVASASGSAQYDVSKLGTSSEVWGEVKGEAKMNLAGNSAQSLASTGGKEVGLTAESSVQRTFRNKNISSSSSKVASYASAISEVQATATASGQAESGAWDPSTTQTKAKLQNENVASSASGNASGNVNAKGQDDSADVSALIQSSASKDAGTGLNLEVSGGPATYASATQTSNVVEVFSQALTTGTTWGSVARDNGKQVVEYGNAANLGAGAITRELGGNALSFSQILLSTSYQQANGKTSSDGNMTLDTYTENSWSKKAVAGATINGAGAGTVQSSDGNMFNQAGYTGGLNHFSYVDSELKQAETRNIATKAFVTTDSRGSEALIKPFRIDTTVDPAFAWSSTEGWYFITI